MTIHERLWNELKAGLWMESRPIAGMMHLEYFTDKAARAREMFERMQAAEYAALREESERLLIELLPDKKSGEGRSES